MFGFDFFELVVIFVVALIVLGPTRLPGVARKAGRWIGKARAMARDFRQQLENEVTLEELNKMTREQSKPAAAKDGEDKPAAASPATAADPQASAAPPAAGTPDESMAASGYPYGTPSPATDTPAATPAADPAAAGGDVAVPQPGDDTYSHSHAAGAAPQPWSPEPAEPEPARPQPEPVPAGGTSLAPDPDAPGHDRSRA